MDREDVEVEPQLGRQAPEACNLRRRQLVEGKGIGRPHACPLDFAKPAVVVAANGGQRQPLQLGHGFAGP